MDTDTDTDTLLLEEMCPHGVICDDVELAKHLDDRMQKKSFVAPFAINKNGTFDKASYVLPTEVMEYLPEYAMEKIKDAATQIVKGDIRMNPYKKNDGFSPCRYCEYSSVCNFDISDDEFKYRRLKKMDKNEFSEKILGGSEDA